MKARLAIIAQYSGDDFSSSNNRFNYLAKFLSNDFDVELITSNFSHKNKTKRPILADNTVNNCGYSITYLDEPGYNSNKSIMRVFSLHIIKRNLRRYLKNKSYDVAIVASPPLGYAECAINEMKKSNTPVILDVQDLWPEAFDMIFRRTFAFDFIKAFYERKAKFIYQSADRVVAVSKTYAKQISQKYAVNNVSSVYIGTELVSFDNQQRTDSIDLVKFVYVGSLSSSYTLDNFFESISRVSAHGKTLKYTIDIYGDGERKVYLEELCKRLNVRATFHGFVSFSYLRTHLSYYDVALNFIHEKSEASIINKHGDYFSSGLFVLSSQQSEEICDLINAYDCGLNVSNNEPEQIDKSITFIFNNLASIRHKRVNSLRLAKDHFARERTYNEFRFLVERLITSNSIKQGS